MKYKLVFTISFLINAYFLSAQTGFLKINANIVLPKDTVESKILLASLDDFLVAARKPNEENTLVWGEEKIETFILLDEVNGIEKSGKFKDDFFYKPYLTNVVPLGDKQYFVEVSYIGVNNGVPLLRAIFEFIAHKSNGSFQFSSLLLSSTRSWKTQQVGGNIFHYQHAINKKKTQHYTTLAASFDKKLKSENKVSEFYCCDNSIELQKLIGVSYKSDYNGQTQSVWASKLGNKKLTVLGNANKSFSNFDEHDLWHERLGLVIPRSKVNNSVDEGCAYLYGGSWGLSWTAIFKSFSDSVAINKNINWARVKDTPVYFQTKGFNNSADYIINALLVKKIEKEKGFAGVWELLNCGKLEKGNDNYYMVLEKLTGITKASYDEKCWELVASEQQHLKL